MFEVNEETETAIQIEVVGKPFHDQRLVARNGDSANKPAHRMSHPPPSEPSFVANTSQTDQVQDTSQSPLSQQAFDFILTLEQQCLNHHKCIWPALLEADASESGHELMLSSPILSYAPTSSSQAHDQGYPEGLHWSTPTASLEHLFALSQQLEVVGGEITPIQMWQQLRRHARFEKFDAADLTKLTTQLLPKVECRG